MNSEKVKEIKKALECCQRESLKSCEPCPYWNLCKEDDGLTFKSDILILINEMESENKRLRKEKEDLRLFNISLGNGKVDMTLGGNTAKSFINAIVQIFEQNNATNFLTTTIETISSGNKYSLVIQKENGQTPSEKLSELKDRIALLEKENETLRNAKVVYETVDYCAEDLRKAEERIAELEKELKEKSSYAKGYADGIRNTYEEVLPQFAEILKEHPTMKIYSLHNACERIPMAIDETLKEFLGK
jgi:hypothetical protein